MTNFGNNNCCKKKKKIIIKIIYQSLVINIIYKIVDILTNINITLMQYHKGEKVQNIDIHKLENLQ